MTSSERPAQAERPMNGWAKGGPTSSRWHQVEFDSRTGTATLRCSGRAVRPGPDGVMDYRWTPPRGLHCFHAACREVVAP